MREGDGEGIRAARCAGDLGRMGLVGSRDADGPLEDSVACAGAASSLGLVVKLQRPKEKMSQSSF